MHFTAYRLFLISSIEANTLILGQYRRYAENPTSFMQIVLVFSDVGCEEGAGVKGHQHKF